MNSLSLITILAVVFMTGYSMNLLYKNKSMHESISGMMITMAVAMSTTLVSGYLIGILTKDLFLTAGVSILIGFFIGFLTGQPISIMAILNGALSGIMCGAVGAMLGVFMTQENPYLLLGILLALYIIISGLIILYIKVVTGNNLAIDTQSISPFSIFAVGVIVISLFLFLYSSQIIKTTKSQETAQTQVNENPADPSSQTTELDVSNESTPKINMKATETGYSPNIIYVKKGAQVELNIQNTLENSCITTFNLPDFNFHHVNLKVGITTLNFTPLKAGEYTFSCGMNMFKGKIIVE